jgi:hypothetical protein
VPQSTQMLYRFTHAASYGEVRADVAEVSRALPAGAVTGAAPGSPRRTRPPATGPSWSRSWSRSR